MKLKLYYLIINILFYLSCLIRVLSFIIKIDLKLTIFASILLIVGILYSILPDILINLELISLSNNVERADLLLKMILFVIYFYPLRNNIVLNNTLTILLVIVDIIIVFFITRRIIDITQERFIQAIKSHDKPNSDLLTKCLFIYCLNMAFYFSMQDTIQEFIIFGILCTFIYLRISERIVKIFYINSQIKTCKSRIFLWINYLVMLVVGYYQLSLLFYSLVGLFCGTVIDIAMNNKTAIIKRTEK